MPTTILVLFLPSSDVYSLLLAIESYSAHLFAIGISCGLLWLRWARPDLPRPFCAWRTVVALRLIVLLVMVLVPFIPTYIQHDSPLGLWHGTYALIGVMIMFGATLYWYTWAKFFPKVFGYRLHEKSGTLSDGTTYTQIVKVPKK